MKTTRARPAPPNPNRKPATTVASPRVSTVPQEFPPPRHKSPKPSSRVAPPKPALRPPKPSAPARRVAQIVDDSEATLLDLIDNLLSKGVVLNAEVILALANVDLVYIRLSALVCAADRILPRSDGGSRRRRANGGGQRGSRRGRGRGGSR